MFDPLQFASFGVIRKKILQKIPLIFPLARWSSFQVQGHHEVLLHLHSYKCWSSSLFKKFYLFEVSYGLFSNCFDLVLTPNGEPCFEYFMAKNLQESKNIPFFQDRHLFIMYIIRQAIFHTYVTTMMMFNILSKKNSHGNDWHSRKLLIIDWAFCTKKQKIEGI